MIERTEDHERVIDDTLMPKYRDRIITLLRKIGEICAEADLVIQRNAAGQIDVYDMCGDDFRWSIFVKRNADDDDELGVDISVEIAEALAYGDDETNDGFGVNFGVNIVEYQGRILGSLTPYNYTPDCWVDARDDEVVEERFAILEQADLSEIPNLIRTD